MADDSFIVSIAPHIKDKTSTSRIMWAVTLSLIPAGAAGVIIFGMKSLFIIIVSILTALITEALILGLRRKDLNAIFDGSAVLTGLLLAYNLPPKAPLWMPIVGTAFAIVVAKQLFGGLGHNIFNPALIGRAFLLVSWPVYMTSWQNPKWKMDALTSATPLALLKENNIDFLTGVSKWDLILGNRPGSLGEVCALALIIGAVYLFWKGFITWHIPVTYISTVAIASWIFNGKAGLFTGDILYFVLSGGLVLGALFMATDYVTSPLSAKGKMIFGTGCGVLTFLIRRFSGYPEGVSYAILMMNALTPIIDRYTHPKWFGWRKE